jgi:dihydrofolate reductase
MRKVIVSAYATLNGKVDDLQEWVASHNSGAVSGYHAALLANCDGLLLGRKTYEVFAAMWPLRAGQIDYADKINSVAKYVASATLKDGDLKWENSHLIDGDLVQGVAELKQRGGQDPVVYGCPAFSNSLLENDLVDEYRILLHPVLLGKGRNLLQDGERRVDLELVDSTVIPPGVVVLTYRPVR